MLSTKCYFEKIFRFKLFYNSIFHFPFSKMMLKLIYPSQAWILIILGGRGRMWLNKLLVYLFQRWTEVSINPTDSHGNSQKSEKVSAQMARNLLQRRKIHSKLWVYFSEDWLQNLIMLETIEVQNGKMWICNSTSACECVLGESFVNGNFLTGFCFLYLMKGALKVTANCFLLRALSLFSLKPWVLQVGVLRLTECQRLFTV